MYYISGSKISSRGGLPYESDGRKMFMTDFGLTVKRDSCCQRQTIKTVLHFESRAKYVPGDSTSLPSFFFLPPTRYNSVFVSSVTTLNETLNAMNYFHSCFESTPRHFFHECVSTL